MPEAVGSLATDSKFEPRSHLTEGLLGCVEEPNRPAKVSGKLAKPKTMLEGRADAERLSILKSKAELCALPWRQARGGACRLQTSSSL